MSSASTHIAAWQAAGLIDDETAERLRGAELDEPEPVPATASAAPSDRPSKAAAFFGPGVSIAEAFAYIGGGFLLSGWLTMIAAIAGPTDQPAIWIAVMSAVSVVGAGAIGVRLSKGSDRFARAAGVVFLVGDTFAAAAVGAAVSMGGSTDGIVIAVLAAAAYLAAAIVFRTLHPSVLTTIGLLIGITATAAALYILIGDRFFPSPVDGGPSDRSGGLIKVALTMAWWCGTAVIMGALGLVEAGRRMADADRRAGMLRFWAGSVAVTGTWLAVSLGDGEGRYIPTIVGDVIVLGVSAVLLGLAFRREAPAYVIAAAYGIILALTDANRSYVASEGTAAAFPLLLEGAILVGVGVAADRLRRRIGPDRDDGPGDPETWAQAATYRP